MKLKGNFWVALFFLALGLFGIIQSLTFRYWESMTLPLAISIIISILAVVEVVRELRRWGGKGETAPEKKPEGELKEKFDSRRLGVVFGWAAGFCLAIYLLGFSISIPVFAFTYLKWRKRSWLVAAIFAVAMLVFSYAVFSIGLQIPLYQGLIFGAR